MFLESVAGGAEVAGGVVRVVGGKNVVGGVNGAMSLETDEPVVADGMLSVYNTTSLPAESREPGCGS